MLSNWTMESINLLFKKNEPLTTRSQLSTTLKQMHFENIVEKVENAGNQHFSPFPAMFSTYSNKNFCFSHIYFVFCKGFQYGSV